MSNFYDFDETGAITSQRGSIVHSLNKNEAHTDYDIHRIAEGRRNVLLLGDYEHDITMADGEQHDTVLSVGFLNGEKKSLDHFKKIFDAIVVDEDATLGLPLHILESL